MKKKPQIKFILLSDFSKEYEQYIEANHSLGYLRNIKSIFKILTESIGDIPLKKLQIDLMEQYIPEIFKKSKHETRDHYSTLRSAFNKGQIITL